MHSRIPGSRRPFRAARPIAMDTLRPMLAESAEGPLDSPDHAYEVKWDGMRVLATVDGPRLSFRTRTGLEAAPRFPELRCLREAVLPERAVLDGEIVRLAGGRPDFPSLQRRIQAGRPQEIERLAREAPAALILFDVLEAEGESLVRQPWAERRRRLEAAVRPGPAIQLSPVWDNGRAVWDTVLALGMEGVMAKRRSGPYLSGRRSPHWLKIKATRTDDLVVGGWTEGTGARAETLGALIVGCYQRGRLVYAGHVGSGFAQADLPGVAALLRSIEIPDCPFEGVPEANARPHWCRPEAVCEVRYLERSPEGRLRFPVFVRWRPDKLPGQCEVSP